jgi:hypothetical protein
MAGIGRHNLRLRIRYLGQGFSRIELERHGHS